MDISWIRAAVQSFYADIWNQRDKSKISVLLHSDFTFRGSLGHTRTGHEGFASYVDFVHAALGNYCCDILDLIVENRQAFARMRFHGIHLGEIFGYAPTGKLVEWTGEEGHASQQAMKPCVGAGNINRWGNRIWKHSRLQGQSFG